MKAKTLQIIWHSKDPVFSIDFHPDGYIATGGGDKDIKLWEMCCDAEGNPHVRYVSSLSGHSRTINCVRFSHSGHCLASAGDSGELLIWRPLPNAAAAPPAATAFATPGPHKDASTAGGSSPAPFGATPAAAAAAAAAAGEEGTAGPAGGWGCAPQVGSWKLSSTLRGHHDDVTDLAWAHDDAVVMSGSVENEVMMFDVESRRSLARLEGHRHYVQGVAWDPLGAWMVSQSADRTVRVHGLKPPPSGTKAAAAAAAKEGMRPSTALAKDVLHTHTLAKVGVQPPATPPQPAAGDQAAATSATAAAADAAQGQQQQQQPQQPAKPLQVPLFHDESLNTFFRRLAWSPEGSLLAVPSGVYREAAGQQPQHATYVYARGHWGCPLLSLPCPSKASTVVRFCPIVFRLRQQEQQEQGGSEGATGQQQGAASPAPPAAAVNVLGLPYRLVLAVATMDSVLLYDMQTCEPLMLVGPLHYAPITDLAWSRDGSCLAVSSHDGYCSVVTFQPGELGEALPCDDPALPQGLAAALSKVRGAAAATAAKAAGGAAAGVGSAAAPATVSPRVVGAGASATPMRPASAPAAAPVSTPASTPQAGQGQPKPRRVVPEAVPPFAGAPAAAAAAGGSSCAPAPAPVRLQPRRVTPQPVPAGQPAPTFGQAAAAPVAAAAAGAGPSTAGPAEQQQQKPQQPAQRTSRPASAAESPRAGAAASGATAPAAAAAAAAGVGRVGLAAVQAALAAAAKKKAAAKRAAEGGPAAAAAGAGAAGAADEDVVIVGEVAGAAGGNKRPKLT